MPYKLQGNCVHKENADGSLGKKLKCHPDHASALAHMRALYASVEDAGKKEFYDSPQMMELPTVAEPIDLSGWGFTPDQAQQTGTLLTLFNGKIHEAMTCISDQLTQRGYLSEAQNKILTDLKGATLKYFNENFPSDLGEMLIGFGDLKDIASKEIALLEQSAQFVAAKELKDSPYDWAMITSSSYQDREGQTISLKAHEQDIAWMEQTGNYGTLDWWHLHPINFQILERKEAVNKLPPYIREHGLILGDCTFSAMYGKLRIEAGTYRSKELKEIMQEHADEDSGSLLFLHPKYIEPDANGVYHNIRTVSRAIMPRSRVSNLASFLASADIGVN